MCQGAFESLFAYRKDKTAWLGETENRIVGFFKSDYVQEVDDYDSMNGKLTAFVLHKVPIKLILKYVMT